MRPEEIREMTDDQIEELTGELADELFQLRMRSAYEELEDPARLGAIRRDIARMKTILHERQLEAARSEEG